MTGETATPTAQRDTSGTPTGVMPPSRDDSSGVTQSRALGLEPVFRAVQIVSSGVSQLTLEALRGGAALGDQQTAAWLRQPNVGQSASAFLSETVVSLALAGNAYWQVQRSPKTGDIVNLRVLPAAEVAVYLRGDGTRTFTYRGKNVDPRGLVHLAYMRIPGRAYGLGPIQAAQERLRGAVDLDGYAGEWFNTSGVPTGVLSSDQQLTTDQADQWRDQWTTSQAQRHTAVLGAGLSYNAIHLSPRDAQFLESQNFTTTALARLFGIPAHLMLAQVEGSAQTYQNVQQADLTFVRWTLSIYYREIEEAFTGLLPRGQQARFKLDGILRPDTSTRYQAHQTAIDAGFETVNEVRALEGLPPHTQDEAVEKALQLVAGAPSLAKDPGLTVLVDQLRQVMDNGDGSAG